MRLILRRATAALGHSSLACHGCPVGTGAAKRPPARLAAGGATGPPGSGDRDWHVGATHAHAAVTRIEPRPGLGGAPPAVEPLSESELCDDALRPCGPGPDAEPGCRAGLLIVPVLGRVD